MSVEVKDPSGRAPRAKGAARKPRADALRNRERLVQVAKAAFSDQGVDVTLDEIARRAEVGIGTLYRHFPTRDAIVQAVYRREVEQLAQAAPRLIAAMPAAEALRLWMRLFVDYIATKRLIGSALGSMTSGTSDLYASAGVRILEAITLLVERGVLMSEIRPDADPNDILRALVGVTYGAQGPGWEASARRLVDIFMDGLQTPR